jgi:hypothetical protein
MINNDWNSLYDPTYETFLESKYRDVLTKEQIKCLVTVNKKCQEIQNTSFEYQMNNKLKDTKITPDKFIRVRDKYFEDIKLQINCNYHDVNRITSDTHYRNQFETGFSNGTLCNNTRKIWEQELFNYPTDMIGFDRPKYGNLPILKDCDVTTYYGNCYFVLKPELIHRTTITLGDSSTSRTVFNFNYFHFIGIDFINNIKKFVNTKKISHCDHYVELQIHGPIYINKDIDKFYYPAENKANLKNSIKTLKKIGIKCYSYK